MMVLVTGGSGCGKSTWAERCAAMSPISRRYYIATMQVYDAESERRVARHRAQRADKGFETIEQSKDLAAVCVEPGSLVLLEDLPNLLANEMFDSGDPDRILPALERLKQRCGLLIVVTNDVFSDGLTYGEGTREYMRRLADIGRGAARLADTVVEVVYSIPVMLKGEL